MKTEEEIALQKCHMSLLQDLDVKDILPHLFQNGMITSKDYEDFEEMNETRTTKCKKLLRNIIRPESKCTFLGFTESLRYNDTYSFLADLLEQEKERLLRKNDYESGDRSDLLYEPVRKINVFTKRRKAISALAHKLKRLSHDGDIKTFQRVVTAIDTKFKKNKLNMTTGVNERMEFADMRFASIEAEISAKRVRYDRSLEEGDMFRDMESVISFTSNPRVSSMSYLARYGSTIAMTDSIDDGLAYVQFAKEHAEHVTPCKDTGMVYYIEVNLLSQKYEKDPTTHLKANILKTSEQGIAQFTDENDEIRKDYQRMLLLKRVFCYLGVGLFCKKIEKAETTQIDIEEAKKVIDFIETSDIWQGMEKRRKMLFYVAKSEYYKQQGNSDLAVVHAKEAQKLGEENNWTAELPNISEMVMELERKRTTVCKLTDASEVDILAELFEDLPDLEDESEENNNDITCSSTNYVEHGNGSNDLPSALIRGVQETGETITQMMYMKECVINDQAEEAVTWATNDYGNTLHSDIASTYAIQGAEEMHKQMMDLKEVIMHDSADETACRSANGCNQRITFLKEVNVEQHTQDLQYHTHLGFNGADISFDKSDKQNMQNNLDKTIMAPCMSYLKSPDNEYEENETSIIKDQFQLRYKKEQEDDNCTHPDLSNDHHFMLLKEQNSISQSEPSPVSESPSNISHNLILLKEGGEIAIPTQICHMSQ
ncbi:uncharacterized protein LOC128552792 [Mercenaria mercenaria]|uniref:uncharacterized protein LOC128552792 n=1 Tax=Mercenaria mercenaria TaxID=6596 RepID=UPI00234EAAD3|nr:uncharacterized protein LOC128552792 [Mercenaria mercenaria]